ncbi:cytochrome P450 [Halobacteriales archaeon QS_4_70_19]|nr:MAG: cytochrome P450 [Halobacteriales archaeon QS_4_70_19]
MSSDTGPTGGSIDTVGSGETYDEGADEATGDPDEGVSDLPLAPYPPNLGHPKLHALRQVQDPIAFSNRASAVRDVYRIWLPGLGDLTQVTHPDHMKRILLTEREKFRKSDDFGIAFGDGLLTVEGEEWAQQRKTLQPLFVRESVMGYADTMVEQVQRRVDRWTESQHLDLQSEMTDLTLDVLFAAILGRELAVDGDEKIRRSAEALHDWFLPTSYPLPRWMPTPARRRFREGKRTLQQEADRLLEEASRNPPSDPTEADDLINLLVGLRAAGVTDSGMLTDERLRDQMVSIIFAGHDTTTTSLTFALWALAEHPDIRERFHAEVDALDGPPTAEDVEEGRLEFTDKVVTETLRLFPPVYALPRIADQDVQFNGYRVPEGERVGIIIRRIQRDPRFFDDPTAFDPDRWTDEFRQSLHDFAYAPFGGGPRICIGRQFALLEAKLSLATIGRNYELYYLGEEGEHDGPPLSPQMTLRMKEGQEFLVTER